MKGKKAILLLSITTLFLSAGCKTGQGSEAGITEFPFPTPTEAVQITSSVGADENVSDAITYTLKEESEEVKDGDVVYFTSYLSYPVFEGNGADNLNRFVGERIEMFKNALPEAKENAAWDYEDAKENDHFSWIFPEKEEFTVSCIWAKEQWQVLFTTGVSDWGGAHPNVYWKAYVVDSTTGEAEVVETFLERYGITKDELIAHVAEAIRTELGDELRAFDNEADYAGEIRRLFEDNQWYLSEKGLVVFANPYELASYANGMVECEISYEELEEGLKK